MCFDLEAVEGVALKACDMTWDGSLFPCPLILLTYNTISKCTLFYLLWSILVSQIVRFLFSDACQKILLCSLLFV